jgi:hypothetical protein
MCSTSLILSFVLSFAVTLGMTVERMFEKLKSTDDPTIDGQLYCRNVKKPKVALRDPSQFQN